MVTLPAIESWTRGRIAGALTRVESLNSHASHRRSLGHERTALRAGPVAAWRGESLRQFDLLDTFDLLRADKLEAGRLTAGLLKAGKLAGNSPR